MTTIEDMIGKSEGIYTIAEAARYARMSPVTVSRWFKGDDYCKKVFSLEDVRLITFLDFVQVLAVRNLRVHYRINLQKIREAINRAKTQFGIEYPFAAKHTTFLFNKEIWIQPEGETITQISGKQQGQRGIIPVIEQFYNDLSFDSHKGGLATKYKAFEKNGQQIFMNPSVRFGEPLLDGCGYTPYTLSEAARTEGSVEEAARAYGVTKEQIEISIAYTDFLALAA